MTNPSILDILNAPMGDYLKAQILAKFHPTEFGDLDLTRLKLPPGMVGEVFQRAKNAAILADPSKCPDKGGKGMTSVHGLGDPPLEKDPFKEVPILVHAAKDEGDTYLTAREVCGLRHISGSQLAAYHRREQWRTQPDPRRTGWRLYNKSDVMRAVEA